jgi:hypothetical protein
MDRQLGHHAGHGGARDAKVVTDVIRERFRAQPGSEISAYLIVADEPPSATTGPYR